MMNLRTDRRAQALAALLLVAAGGAAGAAATGAFEPRIEMAPVRPVPIRSLPGRDGIVSVRARVAETYGNKAVIDDGTARTLIDLGPAGDRAALLKDGQTVTVQGRFDHSVLHASFLVDQGGTVHALRPAGPPPHGPHDRHGPPPAADGPPPPPPPAQRNSAP